MGLIGIIMCMSNGLSQKNTRGGNTADKNLFYKKWKISEKELHLITKLLSVGLVDADPNTLHHIKEYRDLRGSSS